MKNVPKFLASTSFRATFLMLVLFSTLEQAPFGCQLERVTLTCKSQPNALACKDLRFLILSNTAVQAETGPHFLTYRVTGNAHVSFFDLVSVILMKLCGVCMLLLLGAIA